MTDSGDYFRETSKCIRSGDFLPVWKRFLNKVPENINAFDPEDVWRWTPAGLAAKLGRNGILEVLLHFGLDPNTYGNTQMPLLHIAAECGKEHVVRLLLERGAKVHATDARGLKASQLNTTPNIQQLLAAVAAGSYSSSPSYLVGEQVLCRNQQSYWAAWIVETRTGTSTPYRVHFAGFGAKYEIWTSAADVERVAITNLQTLPLGTVVASSATLPSATSPSTTPAVRNGSATAVAREPSPVRMITSTANVTKPVAEAQRMMEAAQQASRSTANPEVALGNGVTSLNSKFPMMQHHLSMDATSAIPSDLKEANQELIQLQERDIEQQSDAMQQQSDSVQGLTNASSPPQTNGVGPSQGGEPAAKRARPQQVSATAVPEPPLSDQEAASLLHHVETLIRQRAVSQLERAGQAAQDQAAKSRLQQLQTENAELQRYCRSLEKRYQSTLESVTQKDAIIASLNQEVGELKEQVSHHGMGSSNRDNAKTIRTLKLAITTLTANLAASTVAKVQADAKLAEAQHQLHRKSIAQALQQQPAALPLAQAPQTATQASQQGAPQPVMQDIAPSVRQIATTGPAQQSQPAPSHSAANATTSTPIATETAIVTTAVKMPEVADSQLQYKSALPSTT
eukprot:m.83297 g.83297  ORF g.83297 m.83297 type:complete len:626 (-) comp14651_c0_seq2:77-1954(-)